MRELIKRFEVKKKLFSSSSGDITLELPEPLNKVTIEGRVREGELTIKWQASSEDYFKPC